jgi:multiple sugar transport system ATP-binding protein
MTALEIRGLTKRFSDKTALTDVNLTIAEGEFLCLLGPTNAGKSTLLKTVAGLHRADRGSIRIAGRDVTVLDPAKRGVSLLFQNTALFPDRTGFENIAFPLRQAGAMEAAVRIRVHEIAELLRIAHILNRRPATFSGGEQQRMAIGRALAQPVDLLLLDEPLSNLDARIRGDLRREFRRLHRAEGRTVLYVTHDQGEALSLADRIAVLYQGRIEQVAAVDDIYDRPATEFVARFIGAPPFNLLPAAVEGGGRRLVGAGFALDLPAALSRDASPERLVLGIRAEAIRLAQASGHETPIAARLRSIEHHGSRDLIELTLGETVLRALAPAGRLDGADEELWLGFDVVPEHLLDPATGKFLNLGLKEKENYV